MLLTNQNDCALVGATGFVGTNLKRQSEFSAYYNSANINDIKRAQHEIIVCAAAPAEMWKANKDPSADWDNLQKLFDCIGESGARRCVLISTIAVLDAFDGQYTETTAQYENSTPYGLHRRRLEVLCEEHFESVNIIRLPSLFGAGLKKNFIYDVIHPAPSFLNDDALKKLENSLAPSDFDVARNYYRHNEQLNLHVLDRDQLDRDDYAARLDTMIRAVGMEAARFTSDDTQIQFYNLDYIGRDIDRAVENEIPVLHICSEPILASDIYEALTEAEFQNKLQNTRIEDMRSNCAGLWGDNAPYLYSRDETLKDIKAFYDSERGA